MPAVLGDLVAPDRRNDRVALQVGDRTDTYREFCTTAWKTAHALRYLGVHEGSRVALAPDPAPQVVASLVGTGLLGGRVRMDPAAEARVVVTPDGDVEGTDRRETLVVAATR
jgi:formylmethanofuran dehydrogenase subunit D